MKKSFIQYMEWLRTQKRTITALTGGQLNNTLHAARTGQNAQVTFALACPFPVSKKNSLQCQVFAARALLLK